MKRAVGTLVIRQMRPLEAFAVARLRIETFFQDSCRTIEQDAEGLSKLADDGSEIALVAELDGELAGTILLVREELDLDSPLSPWLAGLVVRTQFRKRGVGASLVKALEEYASSVGCERIYLYTHGAEAFYAALGWEIAERFIQHGEEAVLMTRGLEETRLL